GIVRTLDSAGVEILPVVSGSAPPGGLVEHEFYLSIKNEIINAAVVLRPDAIALELHGAMGTLALVDVEGDLLGSLREAVGDHIVIGVGLDLHAHLTPAMLRAADLCVACKQNPHSDVVACGEKVAHGVLAIVDGTLHPVTTLCKVQMTLPGAMETTSGP